MTKTYVLPILTRRNRRGRRRSGAEDRRAVAELLRWKPWGKKRAKG